MKASTTQIIKTDTWGQSIITGLAKDSTTPTSVGYTGHKYDTDTDLTYAHARYLSTGRRQWLSLDPMSTDGFSTDYFLMNPQYQNSYSYASNNPVNNADPDGRAVYAGVKAIDGNSIGSHIFLFLKPDEPENFSEYLNGSNGWIVGGYHDQQGGLIKGYNSDYDLNVLNLGYSTEVDGKKIGYSKGVELVSAPKEQTDTQFIQSIMNVYNDYKNDAAYDPFVISGNNSNVFTTTLLQNSGVKNLPFKGNMPGIDPGYGKNLGSSYKTVDGKIRIPDGKLQVLSAGSVYGSKTGYQNTTENISSIMKKITNSFSKVVNSLRK